MKSACTICICIAFPAIGGERLADATRRGGEITGFAAGAEGRRLPLLSGTPPATWGWGKILTVEHASSALPLFRIFDPDANTASVDFPFSISAASLINVRSGRFARGPDGTLAIAGSAYTADSLGSSFLAIVSPDRKQQTVVRSSPYNVAALAIAPDGKIWTVGNEGDQGRQNDFMVVRRFDSTAKTVSAMVPRSTIFKKRGYSDLSDYSYLAAGKDRIGWYADAVGTYTEFSVDGRVIDQFKTPDASSHGMPGLAICDDGSVFVSMDYKKDGAKVWGIYSLQREKRTWALIPMEGKWGMLFGCDGTSLVGTTDLTAIRRFEPITR